MFTEFMSRVIYGTAAEAVITPNHRDFLSAIPPPTGLAWITRYVSGPTSLLTLYENWLAANNLPPAYPYDGSNLSQWDSEDEANVGAGLPLPANLQPASITFATREALGVALRDRLIQMQTDPQSADLQERVKAPYSHRFWGYLKWASLIVRRWDGELVDFQPPLVYDRDGTILSAIPFLNFVNDAHWSWHDFVGSHGLTFFPDDPLISPRGTITPGYSSPVGQRAAAIATTPNAQNEEFLRFHRDHIQMIHNWLARTGQPQLPAINMLSVWTGTFGDPGNRGFPPTGAGNPSTWVETYNRPWVNNEVDVGSPRLRDFATPAALAGAAMGTYHAQGHNSNPDIRHPFKNNYHHRFFAWHQFLDNQWFFRAPRFARWNAATRLRERLFRPVLMTGSGVPWPGMTALTITRDLTVAADAVAPANAISGLNLTTGSGTLRMQFVVRDTYDRLLRARFRADVFNDAVSATVPVETVNVDRTVGPAGTVALGTDFSLDFAFLTAFRSRDPARTGPVVGFVNNRIRITGTLAPDDGSDTAFGHEDHIDIDLVQERQPPEVKVFLNLSSFSADQVASKTAEADGSKRFRNAVMVTVQDRTERPVPISWPANMVPQLEAVLTPPAPAAGLFDDAAHGPRPTLWQPAVDMAFSGVRCELTNGPVKEDASLADNVPQRFTYFYDMVFEPVNDAFTGVPVGGARRARLRFTAADRAGNEATAEAGVKLFRDANPYMIDGDPAWLSQDTRAFRVYEGEAQFGATLAVDQPNNFIAALLTRLNDGTVPASDRDSWFNSLPTFAGQDSLEFSTTIRTPATGVVRKIYNFALGRVRVQASGGASRVRAFFRLFTYSGSNLTFDTSVGYRTHTDGTRKVPLLGFATTNEVISIPFFAVPRLSSTSDMKLQPEDTPNVLQFAAGPTAERSQYVGVYLDINQDTAALPARRVADPARVDGGFVVSEVQPIRTTIRDAHQCMVVEISYDGDITAAGDTPFSSDNLAQRNLVILRSDNPGSPITRTVEHSFEADTRCVACDDEKHPDHAEHAHHHLPSAALPFIATRRDAQRLARRLAMPTRFPAEHDHAAEPTTAPLDAGHSHDGSDHGEHGPGGHDDAVGHDAADASNLFKLAFDPVAWKSTGDLVDELMFVWNGLPEASRVELYLPGIRAENVVNLRNLRHAPRDVRIIDEHRLLLVPNGVTYLPLPPSVEDRVAGTVTITLPDGVKHGQRWTVDVVQLRGHERSAVGAFRLDVRVEKDLQDMAASELRLLETLFERRSLMGRLDRWRPILDRRVQTTRARARAFAQRAGIDWKDPTAWVDDKGEVHDLAGPALSVVLDRIEIRKDYDPWIKGRGEIVFKAVVETSDNAGARTRIRLPEHGVYKISDKPGHNVIAIGKTIFVGHAAEDLRIEITGTERDLFDPDDWIGKYARVLCGPAERWFGEYGPQADAVSPEDVGPWRVWYRILRGGVRS